MDGGQHPNETSKLVERLRKEIDAADVEVARALAARRELTREVQRLKRDFGLPPRDAEREAAILARYAELLPGRGPDAIEVGRAVLAFCLGPC